MAGIPLGGEEDILFRYKIPRVTITLIAVNVVLYIATSYENFFTHISNSWVFTAGFIPIKIIENPNEIYRLFTSMFLHNDLLHIFFNMYYLYIFGRAVENVLGSLRYLALYIASGIAAALFHTVFSALQGPEFLSIPAIGASGAISGVLGAYLMLFPGTSITACWFFWIPLCYTLRASIYLIFWFALQVIYGYLGTVAANPGIAFFAHAGGFIAGIALLPFLIERKRLAVLKLRSPLLSFIWRYIVWPYRGEGLGPIAKTLLILLIALLVGGALYSFYSIPGEPIKMYSLHVYVKHIRYDPITGLYRVSDTVIADHRIPFTTTKPFSSIYNDINILMYRLSLLKLLYNETYAGKCIDDIDFEGRILLTSSMSLHSIGIPIKLHVDEACYDVKGYLEYMKGSMQTRAIIFKPYRAYIESMIRSYTFTIRLCEESLAMIKPMALTAVLCALLAIYTVYKRSSALALIA